MTSYSELPFFRVDIEECERKNQISYGIILKCTTTKRILMLRSKESWSYIVFLRGVYHLHAIKTMVASMTIPEYWKILRCIQDIEYLRSEMRRTTNSSPKNYLLKDSYQRLKDAEPIIRACPIPKKSKLDYSHCRGQLKKCEEPLECAYREFHEETGIDLHTIPHKLSPKQYTKKYITATGLPYTVTMYKAIVECEFEIPKSESHEVEKIKWRNES